MQLCCRARSGLRAVDTACTLAYSMNPNRNTFRTQYCKSHRQCLNHNRHTLTPVTRHHRDTSRLLLDISQSIWVYQTWCPRDLWAITTFNIGSTTALFAILIRRALGSTDSICSTTKTRMLTKNISVPWQCSILSSHCKF